MLSPDQAVLAAGSGPLSGTRVVELGALIAAPFAGRILADFGAEVIKVENPSYPDPFRQWGQKGHDGQSLWWAVQSRNKKMITLDLKQSPGRKVFEDLIETADVLIENFRPGTLERLGIGPEQLHKVNAGLVIARVSGYGQSGRNAARPGYAAIAEAVGGLRYINGTPGEPPPRSGISLGDSLAAMFAVQGILMALLARSTNGGKGQVVDVSLVESCFALLEGAVPEYVATGRIREPQGAALEGIAPSNIYLSADGRWVVIAANQDTVFARLCQALRMPSLLTDPRFLDHAARGKYQREIDVIIGQWVAARSAAEVLCVLQEADVPSSLVNSIADILKDEHLRDRDMFVEIDDGEGGKITHPGIVPKMSVDPGIIRWSGSSTPGQHNAEVLGSLGYTPEELAKFSLQGVIL